MTEPSPVSGVNFRQITANGLDFRIAVAGDSSVDAASAWLA